MNFAIVSIFVLFVFQSAFADDKTTPPVEVVGNKFYFSNNGSQFLMRGIAYQQNTANSTENLLFIDPLADEKTCERDVKYFKELNTNTLRVYAVNGSLDHDACMDIFSEAGIYIIADLSEPDLSINRNNPEWNLDLYKRYTEVVDMFEKYPNVLGFFAGNEVTNDKSNTDASAFVKAAVRDTKKYIKDKQYRNIPVGYSSNDDEDIRVAIADYFACGDLDERADFFGINMYEWCGESTFKTSGYLDRTDEYKNLTIPVFFSEYGCNEKRPRKFTEVGAIFSDDMTDVWSGGIVYMYFEEQNKYGLVSIKGDEVQTLDDYKYYKSEINNISPNYAKSSTASVEATQTFACPASASTWRAAVKLPPTPDEDFCECMALTYECVIRDNVPQKNFKNLYSEICGQIDCSPISVNGSKGEYGSVSFCSDKDKLSHVLNEYYLSSDRHLSACDFNGSATLAKSVETGKTCSAKDGSVNSAGSSNSKSSDTSQSTSTSTKSSGAIQSFQIASKYDLLAISIFMGCLFSGATILFI